MLEILRAVAYDSTPWTPAQLEDIAIAFGDDWILRCELPVGVLIRAYEEYNRSQAAVTDVGPNPGLPPSG